MNALALDLGSKTGYARYVSGHITAGTWAFCSDKELKAQKGARLDRRGDLRISRFWEELKTVHLLTPLDWIFFEDVQFGKTTAQVQLWASLRASVWLFAHVQDGIRVECCPVGTLKKFASGSGAAEKAGMAYALAKHNPQRYTLTTRNTIFDRVQNVEHDDNAVDALHLLNWGIDLTRNA